MCSYGLWSYNKNIKVLAKKKKHMVLFRFYYCKQQHRYLIFLLVDAVISNEKINHV